IAAAVVAQRFQARNRVDQVHSAKVAAGGGRLHLAHGQALRQPRFLPCRVRRTLVWGDTGTAWARRCGSSTVWSTSCSCSPRGCGSESSPLLGTFSPRRGNRCRSTSASRSPRSSTFSLTTLCRCLLTL